MRNVGVHRHLVSGQVMVDEEAQALVHRQLFHQCRADAHGHRADDLTARRRRVEDPSRSAHREHAPYANLASGGIDGDFDEVRAEGRLLIFLGQITELDAVLADQRAAFSRVAQRQALAADPHLCIGKLRLIRGQPELGRHRFAQFHARSVDPSGGAVAAELATGTGRHREVRIAQTHHYIIETNAHHLGGGLRDDRVAAGADIGHVRFNNDLAITLQAHAGAGLDQQVVAKRRRHAHADQPAAFTTGARLRLALIPAEFLRADLQAFDQLALGERPLGFHRVDLSVVSDAEQHRVHLQLFGHFVHGDFQHHQPRCFTRRTHGIAFRQVERGEAHADAAVFCGVEQLARLRGQFDLAVGEVARPAFMGDGGQLAVRRCAHADALDGCWAMGGVVGHLRASEGDFHRSASHARAESGEDHVGADEQLAAETTADVRRDQTDFFLRQAEGFRDVTDTPGDHLVRRPHRQLIAFPRG